MHQADKINTTEELQRAKRTLLLLRLVNDDLENDTQLPPLSDNTTTAGSSLSEDTTNDNGELIYSIGIRDSFMLNKHRFGNQPRENEIADHPGDGTAADGNLIRAHDVVPVPLAPPAPCRRQREANVKGGNAPQA